MSEKPEGSWSRYMREEGYKEYEEPATLARVEQESSSGVAGHNRLWDFVRRYFRGFNM